MAEASMNDAALLARARSGDLDAFAEIVRRHEQRVRAVLLRLLDDERDVEEATQDWRSTSPSRRRRAGSIARACRCAESSSAGSAGPERSCRRRTKEEWAGRAPAHSSLRQDQETRSITMRAAGSGQS
jgi:hypothetical protein